MNDSCGRMFGAGILLFICLLLAPAMAAAQSDACQEAGTLSREAYFSAVTSRESRYQLYLPPCYAGRAEHYPLLTLLHGSDADEWQWARLGFPAMLDKAIQAGSAIPMIVLMPNGGALANSNAFGAGSYDRVLLELLDMADERYRINDFQAIGGISRGGFWAYHLGLRFADQFAAIGGHSPYFDADHVLPAYNPLELATTLEADTHLKLWLDRGSRDHAAPGIDSMHVRLRQAGVAHDYKVYADGGHSEAAWARNIADYVAFYARALASPADTGAAQPPTDGDEIELWLPAVGFGAPLASIDSADLNALLAGALDRRLLLSQSAMDRLSQYGFSFHGGTRIVPHDRLFYELWRDKRAVTILPFDELHPQIRPLWLDDLPIVDQLGSYPLAIESPYANFSRDKLTRITLSGTTALARNTLPAIDAMGLERAASGIRDYVRLADYFQITNEASIVPGCPEAGLGLAGKDYSLCMKREHARLFDLLDVDIVDLTGNHINDYRFEPLLDTLDDFKRQGIAVVGGGPTLESARKPLILEHNGSRIGWLACNWIGPAFALASDNLQSSFGIRPGGASCHGDWLRDALAILAAEVDLVLMTLQYREYDKFTPQLSQATDFQRYAEWGADIVIGTAEHKPMTYAFYPTRRGETAFIHYGLGNLYFDQLGWGHQRFLLDTLYVYSGKLVAVEVFPGLIDERARPRLLEGDDRFNFLHFMFIQMNEF